MASTFVSSAGKLEDGALGGIRRSRFSFHLRTPGARRWLLVQLVSVPVKAEAVPVESTSYNTATAPDLGESYSRLLDDYSSQQFTQRSY